jgi:hypothetical protein
LTPSGTAQCEYVQVRCGTALRCAPYPRVNFVHLMYSAVSLYFLSLLDPHVPLFFSCTCCFFLKVQQFSIGMKISPLLVFLAPLLIRAQNCWAPNGNTLAVLDFKPCIAIAGMDSKCCALNRTLADTLDTCEQNRMCLYQERYFRAYCTDRT